jgi:hypothetical protein
MAALDKPPRVAPTFAFSTPEVTPVDVVIWPTEPATLAHLRAFLWLAGGPLPAGVTGADIEAVAIAHASDRHLLSAFFIWASTTHFEIDASAWAERIRLTEFDELTAVVIASFMLHWQGPPTTTVLRLLEAGFAIVGFPLTDASVLKLLRTQRGVGWLLARNVIRMEPTRLSAFAPLPTASAIRDSSLFTAQCATSDPQALFSAAADMFIEPAPTELALIDANFPAAYALPPQLLAFIPDPPLPTHRSVPGYALDALLAALTPRAPLDLYWFHFFNRVSLDAHTLPRVRALFSFEGDGIEHAFPSLLTCAVSDDETRHALHRNPPSFSRAFVRSLASPLLPPARLSPEALYAVGQSLRPVFAGLAYSQGAQSGVRAHIAATPLSALRYGVYSASFGKGLLRTLESRSWEALAVAAGLLQLPGDLLHTAIPQVTREMAREEVLKKLLQSATGGEASVAFARRAIACVIAWAAPEQVMVIVGNAEFLARQGFDCVCVVFRVFSAKVAKDGPREVADWCKVLQGEEGGVFQDEFKRRVFSDLSKPENIAAALHGSP